MMRRKVNKIRCVLLIAQKIEPEELSVQADAHSFVFCDARRGP